MSRLGSLLSLLVLAAVAAPSALAQAPPPRIQPGVKAVGVDVGGLTVEEATARLEEQLAPRLTKNISVHVAGRGFSLSAEKMDLKFDAGLTARRALRASQKAPPEQAPTINVAPGVEYRAAAVRDFANRIDRSVYIAPRNATVRMTVSRMIKRRARSGRDMNARELRAAIERTLVDPAAKRLLKPGRKEVPAKINANDLARVYSTVVTIDRGTFKLRLFKSLKLAKTYRIAVGAAGYDTPAGRYRIQNKTVNPAWTAPNKPWAGLYAGQTVPGGSAENPLKARWLGIANGVGIHGTSAAYSIGTRASHGCIRMTVPDVIALYDRVPVGTAVLIK
jgi:lipoprotein-anchoring transpeptidase ErfK/SrfK